MRICLARSIIEDSGITPDSFVNEARQLLANRQGVDKIENSIFLMKEIDGSVMIHHATNCLVICSCLQIRIHNSSDSFFALSIPNHPVIEDCDRVWFGENNNCVRKEKVCDFEAIK